MDARAGASVELRRVFGRGRVIAGVNTRLQFQSPPGPVLSTVRNKAPNMDLAKDGIKGELQEEPEKTKEENTEPQSILDRTLQIPPIPHESDTVLEPADVEFQYQEVFGYNEIVRQPGVRTIPKFNFKFVSKDDQRYFIEKTTKQRDPVELPLGIEIKVNIMYVDNNDVFYVRWIDERGTGLADRRPDEMTVEELHDKLHDFYGKEENRRLYCLGMDGWIPVIGEVVVVHMVQKFYRNTGPWLRKLVYLRARVFQVELVGLQYNVGLVLLDDFGKGVVPAVTLYKIHSMFTKMPPQMFTCELSGLGLFRCRKVVHRILREKRIPGLFSNAYDNVFNLKFIGEYSKEGKPLVELSLVNMGEKIYVKEHLLENMATVVSPMANLMEGHPECRVLRYDFRGTMSIQFMRDEDILRRVDYILTKFGEQFKTCAKYCPLTLTDILTEAKASGAERKLFVALVPEPDQKLGKSEDKHGDSNEKEEESPRMKYRRVVVKSFQPGTNLVTVRTVDYDSDHKVSTFNLVPLSVLCPDMCFIPPMCIKVKLHNIKELTVNSKVKGFLFDDTLKVALVQRWPEDLRPPDVLLFPASHSTDSLKDSVDLCRKLPKLVGLTQFFVDQGLAKPVAKKDMEFWHEVAVAWEEEKEALEEEKKERNRFFANFFTFHANHFDFGDSANQF